MATLFVRHTVKDYAAWRKAYDAFAPEQKAGGVTASSVHQSADDPNDVTVTHEFATVDAAKAFAGNPKLKQAMQGAGVVGAPAIWFTKRV